MRSAFLRLRRSRFGCLRRYGLYLPIAEQNTRSREDTKPDCSGDVPACAPPLSVRIIANIRIELAFYCSCSVSARKSFASLCPLTESSQDFACGVQSNCGVHRGPYPSSRSGRTRSPETASRRFRAVSKRHKRTRCHGLSCSVFRTNTFFPVVAARPAAPGMDSVGGNRFLRRNERVGYR